MTTALHQSVTDLCALLEAGDTLAVIERFYAPDACVFENRMLARSGRDTCLVYEREQLGKQPEPPRFRIQSLAINEADGVVFLEYVVRFMGPEQRPMRMEQVAVQQWHRGLIAEERFYYEGVVDEGDE